MQAGPNRLNTNDEYGWERTLANILSPTTNITSPMSTSDRYKFRKIANKLTFPLIYAYRQMIKIARGRAHPGTTTTQPIAARSRHRIGLLMTQTLQPGLQPALSHQRGYLNPSEYTFSDAAFRLTDANLGIVHLHS